MHSKHSFAKKLLINNGSLPGLSEKSRVSTIMESQQKSGRTKASKVSASSLLSRKSKFSKSSKQRSYSVSGTRKKNLTNAFAQLREECAKD
jgi:hypothetical protein